MIIPNNRQGENMWHVWNADVCFTVFTQRATIGSRLAHQILSKEYGKVYMDITYCAPKGEIKHYFS